MDDHSHLVGATHESKGLINEGHTQPESGQELLEKMKHISNLITEVRPSEPAEVLKYII